MLPAAPPLYSITICWPRNSPSVGVIWRATRSLEPPGGNGTMSLTGLVGYGCACAISRKTSARKPTIDAATRMVHLSGGTLRRSERAVNRASSFDLISAVSANLAAQPRPGGGSHEAQKRPARNSINSLLDDDGCLGTGGISRPSRPGHPALRRG